VCQLPYLFSQTSKICLLHFYVLCYILYSTLSIVLYYILHSIFSYTLYSILVYFYAQFRGDAELLKFIEEVLVSSTNNNIASVLSVTQREDRMSLIDIVYLTPKVHHHST